MSSILPPFQYFDFVSTPVKQNNLIVIPGAPIKRPFNSEYDSEDEQEHFYSLIHPLTQDQDYPMTIEELNLDSDSDAGFEYPDPNVTMQRGDYDDEDSFLSLNDSPMSIEELSTDDEADIPPYVSMQRGVSYWNYIDEESFIDYPMSIDELATNDEEYPDQNVTIQRGTTYDDEEDSFLDDPMSIDELATNDEEDSFLDDPMSIDELETDEEDDPICVNLQYEFENAI